MTIGEVIQSLRLKANMSQESLANVCNISQTYLSHIETNKREPHLKTLKVIAEKLAVPLGVLFFLTLDINDIPPEKRNIYNHLFQPIKNLVIELFPVTDIKS